MVLKLQELQSMRTEKAANVTREFDPAEQSGRSELARNIRLSATARTAGIWRERGREEAATPAELLRAFDDGLVQRVGLGASHATPYSCATPYYLLRLCE